MTAWEPDVLPGYWQQTLTLGPDPDGEGELVATLIRAGDHETAAGRGLDLPRPLRAFLPNLSTTQTQVCKLMVFELRQLFALAVELYPSRYHHNRFLA